MVAPKKGQGIAFKIPGQDADAPAGAQAATDAKAGQPRTGVGLLSRMIQGAHAETEAVAKLTEEIAQQRARADQAENERGAILVDPKAIVASAWANRHEASFRTPDFEAFKAELKEAGGNVQAIKVRPIPGNEGAGALAPKYEVVFGHRRHRGCLELGLPVKVVVEALDDASLFAEMDRENRGRKNLSAWEQGTSYRRALERGLFPSIRQLAAKLGIDHSQASKAMRIAQLPPEVIAAFASPNEISYPWVIALDEATKRDPAAVASEARRIAQAQPRLKAPEVFRALVASSTAVKAETKPKAREVKLRGGRRAVIRVDGKGRTVVTLESGALAPASWDALEAALKALP